MSTQKINMNDKIFETEKRFEEEKKLITLYSQLDYESREDTKEMMLYRYDKTLEEILNNKKIILLDHTNDQDLNKAISYYMRLHESDKAYINLLMYKRILINVSLSKRKMQSKRGDFVCS